MSAPLIATKLHIPPVRPDLVPRPELIERLKEGLKRNLILISAPAGFGKTTLLSSLIGASSLPFGWVSLDEEDDTPVRFLMYIIAALRTIDPHIGETILPALQSPQPPPVMSVLPFLINDIAACPELVLALDDYHLIKAQDVHKIVDFILQYMPASLHLVIATRVDPPLPLSRLHGRRQLTELRAADLRFSHREAGAFFNQTRNLRLSDREVAALNTRAEGWITGLQMAVLSMKGREDKSQFIQSFTGSNRYILDYLLEEVLDYQTQEIRDFLLKTSILDRLSAGLCRAVTGEIECQRLLEEMERANLFVVTLDDERRWFRFHHLFAHLLRQRLLLNDPNSIPELHQRASCWYEENGFLGPAIEHALAATDSVNAVRLVGKYVQSMWEYGDQSRLTKWLAMLPQESLQAHPMLLAHHAFALCFSGQFDAAEAELASAERHVDPGNTLFQGMAATVRAFYALYSNRIDAAAGYAQLALEHLPPNQPLWRSLALSVHGDVHAFYGHVPTCEAIWGEALLQANLANSLFFALLANAKLVVTRKRLGRLRQAAQTFEEQTQRAVESGHPQMAVAGALYAVYGDILLEWNRVDEALEYIQRGLVLSERQNYVAGIAWSSLSLIHARFAQMDIHAATEALAQLDDRMQRQKLPIWTLNWFNAWKARLLIARDDLEGAERVLRAAGITLDGEFGYPNEVEYLALARLLMTKGDLHRARKLLVRLHAHLESKGWLDKIIEVQILQALVNQAQGDTGQALDVLDSVLRWTQPEGYTRIFANEGLPMARLLNKALEANLQPEYVHSLLTAFPVIAEKSSVLHPQTVYVEPLSPREMDVLRQIAAGASNQETALALHIALGTVKNHLKNIYAKLNVHSRTQAIVFARSLGIIED